MEKQKSNYQLIFVIFFLLTFSASWLNCNSKQEPSNNFRDLNPANTQHNSCFKFNLRELEELPKLSSYDKVSSPSIKFKEILDKKNEDFVTQVDPKNTFKKKKP